MIARLALVLVMAVALSAVDAGQANAQCGIQGGPYGYGFGGYGYDVGQLYRVLSQNVPYYAAFPPVYYSAPIPRTYGYSPFAYPPGTATPELVSPTLGAKEILNPYVPASTKSEAEEPAENNVTKNGNTPVPLAITNPYVNGRASEMAGPILQAAVVNR